MYILLWTLQIILALHTIMGAVWKFRSSDRVVPSLGAIPRKVWLGLSSFELICSVGLLIPLLAASLAMLAPLAALGIGAEMLLFCGVHLRAGATKHGPLVYWLVVAALCAFVAYGRFVLIP